MEITVSRFGGDTYSIETVVDLSDPEREETLKPAPPPPTLPAPGAPGEAPPDTNTGHVQVTPEEDPEEDE